MPRGKRKPKSLWDKVALPNQGSAEATPASLRLDLHYMELRIWERWTWERFSRLATFLRLTPGELASLAGISHRYLPALRERNGLYHGFGKDRAGALVLTLIEAHACKAYSKDVVENPFPDLNQMAEGGEG